MLSELARRGFSAERPIQGRMSSLIDSLEKKKVNGRVSARGHVCWLVCESNEAREENSRFGALVPHRRRGVIVDSLSFSLFRARRAHRQVGRCCCCNMQGWHIGNSSMYILTFPRMNAVRLFRRGTTTRQFCCYRRRTSRFRFTVSPYTTPVLRFFKPVPNISKSILSSVSQ